ncbi:hypothetical protein BU23DRAFT_308442 [Bimuria novae-zelandiae CBS 107.79]|uniref:Uncharacterized protein n=1 Tax=Bimuria novae-zelandiae CBS 107.79 TaxID=1447943 RepID=A0A6A5UQ28_9PLEO|nr:hypothetical protein BU23DRAFT_308442 [Bimuria novae-zelandiae CBS 107.79]
MRRTSRLHDSTPFQDFMLCEVGCFGSTIRLTAKLLRSRAACRPAGFDVFDPCHVRDGVGEPCSILSTVHCPGYPAWTGCGVVRRIRSHRPPFLTLQTPDYNATTVVAPMPALISPTGRLIVLSVTCVGLLLFTLASTKSLSTGCR